uniref:Uncharacterized protein n=1 Tax=Lactuca sativa TaxID=4236 RepID=A0A9R1W1U7_LACSA|nr:hypothetical protein LSAT_V11C400172460 [Lactuca sativa]
MLPFKLPTCLARRGIFVFSGFVYMNHYGATSRTNHFSFHPPSTLSIAQENPTDNPSMFSIRLNYGGVFTKFPGRKYIKGKMKYIDGNDSDLF